MLDRIPDNQQLARQLSGLARQRNAAQTAQAQLSSGQRADSYRALGTDTGRLIDLNGAVARQEAYANAAQRADLLLARQTTGIGQVRDSVLAARDQLLTALASGTHAGVAGAVSDLVSAGAAARDARHEGRPLFSDPAAPVVRIGDGRELSTETTIDELAAIDEVAAALVAVAGRPPGTALAEPAAAMLRDLVVRMNDITESLVHEEGRIGRRQSEVTGAVVLAQERADILKIAKEKLNGVDPAEAITRLTQAEAALQASYTVISRLQNLNLTQFL
ncbi:MAG: flagellin [Pacificimonas sp.]